jgi:hypothetical protein
MSSWHLWETALPFVCLWHMNIVTKGAHYHGPFMCVHLHVLFPLDGFLWNVILGTFKWQENPSCKMFRLKTWLRCHVTSNFNSPWNCCCHLKCVRLLVLLPTCPFALWVWLHLTDCLKIWYWVLMWKIFEVPHLIKIKVCFIFCWWHNFLNLLAPEFGI